MRRGKRWNLVAVAALLALVGGSALVTAARSRASGQEAAVAAAVQPDTAVSWVTSGITIHASYRAPANGATGAPAALIVGGTGDVDRDGNSPLLPGVDMGQYRWLADRLSALGIASLRYDKVGTGATGLGPYTSDPSPLLGLSYDQLRIQPARDGLRFLARQPGVNPHRLILIGHSEGGAVAMHLVTHLDGAPTPAGLALVEPSYSRILDVVERQFLDQMHERGAGRHDDRR